MITSMKSKKIEINKEMLILDLAENYPELVEVLTFDYGMHCIGCRAAASESLEEGAKVHGMSTKEIDEMVKNLNKIIKGV